MRYRSVLHGSFSSTNTRENSCINFNSTRTRAILFFGVRRIVVRALSQVCKLALVLKLNLLLSYQKLKLLDLIVILRGSHRVIRDYHWVAHLILRISYRSLVHGRWWQHKVAANWHAIVKLVERHLRTYWLHWLSTYLVHMHLLS